MTKSILEEIGVQEWRLRKPILNATNGMASVTVEQSQETAPEVENTAVIEPRLETVSDLSPVELVPQAAIEQASERIIDWPALEQLLGDGSVCSSCSKGNSLLGSGVRDADWLFIGDSPNTKEVAADAFFDGRAGLLFEAMLQALNLDRESVYCTSIFKCAPTEDLSNTPQCGDWVHHQIALVKPKVIIVFGEFAAQTFLKSNDDLLRLRENVQMCRRSDTQAIPTFSPREMLEEPHLKAQVWADIKKAMRL